MVGVFQAIDAKCASTASGEDVEANAADDASDPGGRPILLGDVGNTVLAASCATSVNRHI